MAPLSKLMAPYSTSMAPLSTSMTPYPTSMDAYSSQPYPTVTAPTNSGVFSKEFSQNHSVAPYPKTSGDSAPLSISMAPYPISMAPLSTSMAPYPTSMDAYSSQPYPTVSAPTNSEIFPKEFSQNQSVAPYLITSGNSAPYPVAPNLQSNVESRPTASVPSFNSSAPYPVPFEACPLDSNMSLFAPPTFVESERQPSFNPNI